MKFDAAETRKTYSDRAVDKSWIEWCRAHLSPIGKDVVDVGCGGGIYAFGFAAAGARSVLGVDRSEQYIQEAQQVVETHSMPGVSFRVGSATHTSLPPASADIVFERALIHHLSPVERAENAIEAHRLLRSSGLLIVQDRTFEDVLVTDPACWIRSTLFEVFPRLLEFERVRRPAREDYEKTLWQSGFSAVDVLEYKEVRKVFKSFAELEAEILARKGKSILYELSDGELKAYCTQLELKSRSSSLVESDVWTVWRATRNS